MNQAKIAALISDSETENRLIAVRSLVDLPGFSESLFLRALGDDDWRVRKEAIAYYLKHDDAAERSGMIVDQLSHPDNAGLRNAAIEILVGLGEQAVTLLTERMPTADAEVRKFIVDILGEIGCRNCVTALLSYLYDDDENVCYAAVETLGKLRSDTAVEALLDLLDHSDAGLQFAILTSLSSIAREIPLRRIVPYLQNPLLRKMVYACLGHLSDLVAVPFLLEGISQSGKKMREVALLALGDFLSRLPLSELMKVETPAPTLIHMLSGYLSNIDLKLRLAACRVLALYPDCRVIKVLLPQLDDEALRAAIVSALRRIPHDIFNQMIQQMSVDDENAVYLIYLCGELENPAIEPLAVKAGKSENQQLRYAAALSLQKVGTSCSVSVLSSLLSDPVLEIREAAALALCHLKGIESSAVIDILQPLLRSDSVAERLSVVQVLGCLPIDIAKDSLLAALADTDKKVRCEALKGLTGYRSESFLQTLSRLLFDDVPEVRCQALDAVSLFPQAQAYPLLKAAMTDSDPWIRKEVLIKLKPAQADLLLPILQQGEADAVGFVVIAALEAAFRLLGTAADRMLTEALMHHDPEVMSTSVRLLCQNKTGEIPLHHERSDVRFKAIAELIRNDYQVNRDDVTACLKCETDPEIRQALEALLRKGAMRQSCV